MQAIIRRKLSMARRALDFASAHPVADGSFATIVKRLDAMVTRGDALGMQQSDGRIGESAAVARRRTLRDTIRSQQLSRLVGIAELAAKDHPELVRKFLMPRGDLPNKTFLLAARSLLTAAIPRKELFVSLGLGDTFIEDLTQSLDELEAATETAHTGHSDHVGARADLTAMARDCVRDVRLLDTYFRAAFPNDLELLGAWESARNVAGPFRHQADIPATAAA